MVNKNWKLCFCRLYSAYRIYFLPASVSGGIEDAAFMGCKNLHLENVYIHGTDSLHYQFADSGIVSIRVGSDVKSIWVGAILGVVQICSPLR